MHLRQIFLSKEGNSYKQIAYICDMKRIALSSAYKYETTRTVSYLFYTAFKKFVRHSVFEQLIRVIVTQKASSRNELQRIG